MAGAVLILHFGAFYLLSLTYRAAGIAANPLMRSPGLAVSLSDFWANRWNTGFNKLAHNFLFLPLARRAGGAWAIFFVFIASGMVHDLEISLPARGGYGLPTAYFALQGMAVLLEKSRAGAAFGLGRGWRGWLFMLVVTVSPAPILFHSAFVKNVVLPMLQAIGGIWGKS
jgi:alginate O-acetyltransferase complex protein AlgI